MGCYNPVYSGLVGAQRKGKKPKVPAKHVCHLVRGAYFTINCHTHIRIKSREKTFKTLKRKNGDNQAWPNPLELNYAENGNYHFYRQKPLETATCDPSENPFFLEHFNFVSASLAGLCSGGPVHGLESGRNPL